jgi:hypothetical protein
MNKNNPYDFVPLGPAADRMAIATQEKFAGHSGTLTCRLQTLTHFFIAGNQERQARNQHQELRLLREGNAPIIPGSSLKGAIRHLAEALSARAILPNDPQRRLAAIIAKIGWNIMIIETRSVLTFCRKVFHRVGWAKL